MSPQPLKLDAKVNVPNSLILIGQVYLEWYVVRCGYKK